MSVTLRTDLWPAHVQLGDDGEVFSPARLLLSMDEIWVWFMRDGERQLVVNERVLEVDGSRNAGWTVQLENGEVLYFRRASGCGCGNPLRGFQPPFITMQGPAL